MISSYLLQPETAYCYVRLLILALPELCLPIWQRAHSFLRTGHPIALHFSLLASVYCYVRLLILALPELCLPIWQLRAHSFLRTGHPMALHFSLLASVLCLVLPKQ